MSNSNVYTGKSISCGCYGAEGARLRLTKHGQSNTPRKQCTPEYKSWQHAKGRTTNPKDSAWNGYGGRGIKMYEPWLNNFKAFFDYVGPKPEPKNLYSLDRINVNGDYEPGNVRWATLKEQANNKRGNISMKLLYAGLECNFDLLWQDQVRNFLNCK